MGNKWGLHSGVGHMKDCKISGDLYVQDDIVFSDVSAGTLGVTGGIDMQSTISAIGINMGGTHSTSAINIDGTIGSAINITVSNATTSPSRLCYWQYTSTGNMSAGGMTGIEIRSTFNGSATTANSVTGAEIKARHTTGNIFTVGELRGIVGNADTKNGTTTTAYAVQGSIDVAAGGTITTSACFHGNLNNSGTVTTSYGVFVEGVSGYNLTKGIFMRHITTGIDIAACTTGINISGATTNGIIISGASSGSAIEIVTGVFGIGLNVNADGTTGIAVSNAFSGTTMLSLAGTGTDGINISGICGDAIEISGAATTTGINISANCVTGINISAQTTAGISIGASVTSINFGTPTGSIFKLVADNTIVSASNQAILVDISATANAGFIKVILDANTVKYIALYNAKAA